MDSEIKKATNISRPRPTEKGEQLENGASEIFEEPWDEMVIRFDKKSHQFMTQRIIVAIEDGSIASN